MPIATEAQKNINKFKGNQYTKESGCADYLDNQIEDSRAHQGRTILQRAKEEGVSHFTIGQNQKFAQGVDAIREVSPELAEKILKPACNRQDEAMPIATLIGTGTGGFIFLVCGDNDC